MSKFMTYDYWVENFKPIKNNLVKYDSLTFETYDEEYEFVKSANPNCVWTEVDGDSGTYIVSGLHWVNRIHYYITENPWEDEYTEIPTWVYRDCDCRENNEDYDFDPLCEECNEGTIDIHCETVVDLKEIYGEEADIVG